MGSIRLTTDKPDIINTLAQTPSVVTPVSTFVDTSSQDATTGVSATAKPTVNLFDSSAYETTPKTLTMPDGSTFTLPTLSEEDSAQMQNLFGNIPAEQQPALNEASQNLATALIKHVVAKRQTAAAGSNTDATAAVQAAGAASAPADASLAQIQDGPEVAASTTSAVTDGIKTSTRNAVTASGAATATMTGGAFKLSIKDAASLVGPSTQPTAPVAAGSSSTTGFTVSQASPDVAGAINVAASAYNQANSSSGFDNTVQAVAYMGVQGLQGELTTYANTMQGTIDQTDAIRTDQSELNQAVADWPSGTDTQTFTYHNVDSNGNLQTYTQSMTQAQAKAMADSLDNTLSSLSDTTQLQQTKLQNMMQNYQEGVTTISNIMAEEYNMVKNTISNIHY